MNKSLEIWMIGLIVIVCCAASPCVAQETWSGFYGESIGEELYGVTQTEDGGFVLVGFRDAQPSTWIVRLDQLGNVLWQKGMKLSPSGDNLLYSVAPSKDGGFLVTGLDTQSQYGYNMSIAKVSASGDLLWQKTLGGPSSDYGTTIVRFTDDTYLVSGTYLGQPWIVKIRDDGEVLWQKTYNVSLGNYLITVAPTADGGFCIYYSVSGNVSMGLIKANATGEVLWSKVYPTMSYGGTAKGRFAETEDGGFVLPGRFPTTSTMILLKVNSSGDIVWSKSYPSPIQQPIIASNTGIMANGDLLVTGWFYIYGALVMRVGPDGTVLSAKHITEGSEGSTYALTRTKDGGFLVGGSNRKLHVNGWDFWAIKLDQNGGLPSNCLAITDRTIEAHDFSSQASTLATNATSPQIPVLVASIVISNTNADASICLGPASCSLTCDAVATPSTGQAPLTVNFSATAVAASCTGSISYNWSFGDGQSSSQKNPTHSYLSPGSYSWSMTATIQGITCTKTGTITVAAACTLTCAASATPSSGQVPLSVAFTATATPSNCSGSVAYAWTFGDGGSSTQQNPSHTYTSAGSFTWSMTANVAGVSCTKTGTVSVSQVPTCSISCTATATPNNGAAPLSVNFTASATPTSCTGTVVFSWNFGDGETSDIQSPIHSYGTPGLYTWTMTASIQGVTCVQSGTVTVEGICHVACTADVPATGSEGTPVSFIGSATPSFCQGTPAFAWTFGDGGTSIIQNPRHTYLSAGEYPWTMTATVEGEVCTQAGSITIRGNCSLTCAGEASPENGMAPLTVNFVGTATPVQCLGTPAYTWDFGDGQNSTAPAPNHTYSHPGTYAWTLVVIADDVQCVQEGTIIVTANPNPPLLAIGNASAATGSNITVPITLSKRGASICGLTTDLTFDSTKLDYVQVQIGPSASEAGKSISATVVSPGLLRIAIIGINVTPMGDGVVAEVRFHTAQGAAGSTTLDHACGATDCQGVVLGMACPGGTVTFTSGVPGDCDNDGSVSIGEVQKAVNMFLGLIPVDCGVDCNDDGAVSIGEVQKVINAFLGLASSC